MREASSDRDIFAGMAISSRGRFERDSTRLQSTLHDFGAGAW